jgi:hypothetical protein
MKLFPIYKALFGYLQMADEPMFADLQFVMFDLAKLEVERGEREATTLNGVKPGVLKNQNTMFCFPTPRKQDLASPSQLTRLQFIVDHRERFEQAIKDFLTNLRSASRPVFPMDYPIERCIGDLSIVIPYEDNSGIYVSFAFSDWGACKGKMVVFYNWDEGIFIPPVPCHGRSAGG